VLLEDPGRVAVEFEQPELVLAADDDRSAVAPQMQSRSRGRRFAGPQLDQHARATEHAFEQDLDTATRVLVSVQPGRHDPGVVEHQQVTRSQQPRQV
jgi:hypothetical protein